MGTDGEAHHEAIDGSTRYLQQCAVAENLPMFKVARGYSPEINYYITASFSEQIHLKCITA
eukprot:2156851-Amphidinium_carterae.1